MKFLKYFLVFVLVNTSYSVFAQKSTDSGYDFKVKIKGSSDTVNYLAYYYGDKQYLKDTAFIGKDGFFHYKKPTALDGGIYLIVTQAKSYFETLIDKEQKFVLETDTANMGLHAVVKGSKENELYYEYIKFITPRGIKMDSLRKAYEALPDKNGKTGEEIKNAISKVDDELKVYKNTFIATHPEHLMANVFKAMEEPEPLKELPKKADGTVDSTYNYFYFKNHFLDNIDFTDDRLLRTPIYHAKLEKYMTQLTLQLPDSINISADTIVNRSMANKELQKYTIYWITYYYESSKHMGMDAVFVHMAENYYNKGYAFWADTSTLNKVRDRAAALSPILIGKNAPKLEVLDNQNRLLKLHDLQAKYTCLVFWDPGCGHCQKQIPVLLEVYHKYMDKGLRVFAVCTEADTASWQKYVIEKGLDWYNFWDPYGNRRTYDILTTPQIFLLDEKKNILAKKLAAEQLGDFLDRIIEIDSKKSK